MPELQRDTYRQQVVKANTSFSFYYTTPYSWINYGAIIYIHTHARRHTRTHTHTQAYTWSKMAMSQTQKQHIRSY